MARNSAFDTYMQKIKPAKSTTEVTNLSRSGPFICEMRDPEQTKELSVNKQNKCDLEDIVKCTTVSLSRGKAYVFRDTDEGRNHQKTETRAQHSKRSDESSTVGSSDQKSGGSVERSNGVRTKDQNGRGGVLGYPDLKSIDQNDGESVERSSRLGTRDKNSGKSVYRNTSLEIGDKNSGASVDSSTSLETRDKNSGESVQRSIRVGTRDKNSGESVDRSTSLETTVKKIWERVEKKQSKRLAGKTGNIYKMALKIIAEGTCTNTELKHCGMFNMPKKKLSAAGVMLSTPQCWNSSEDRLKLLSPIVNVECIPASESSEKRKSDKSLSSHNSAQVDSGTFTVVHLISPRGLGYNKTEQVIKQQHVDQSDDYILSSCMKDNLNESRLLATNACLTANTSVKSKGKTQKAQEYHTENVSTEEVANTETGISLEKDCIQSLNKIESDAEHFTGQRQGGYEKKAKSRKNSKAISNRKLASILTDNDLEVSTKDYNLRKRQKIDYTATKNVRYGHFETLYENGSNNNESENEHAVEQDSGIDGQETSETTNATSEGSSIESLHFQSAAESAGEISDQNSLQFNESKDVSETGSNTSLPPSSFLVDTFLDSKRCYNDDMKNEDPFSLEDDVASSTSAMESLPDVNNVFSTCEEINQDLYEALIKKQANKNKQKHIKLIYQRKSADTLSDSDTDISEKGDDLSRQQIVVYTDEMIERLILQTKLKNDQSESTNGTKVKNGKFNQDTERKDQEHEDSRRIKFIHSQSVTKSSRELSDDDAIKIDRNGKVFAKIAESSKKRKSDKSLSSHNFAQVDSGTFTVVHQISPHGAGYNKMEQVLKQQHVDQSDDYKLSSCMKDNQNESRLLATNACLTANTSAKSKEKTQKAQEYHTENISTEEVANTETGISLEKDCIQNLNTIESDAEHFTGQRQGGYEKEVKSRKNSKAISNRKSASILTDNDLEVSTKDYNLRKRQKIDYTATKIVRYGHFEKPNGTGSSNHVSEQEHTRKRDSGINGQETTVTTNATSDVSSIESMHFESTAQSTGESKDEKSQQFSESKDETDLYTSLSPCQFIMNTYSDSESQYEKEVKSRKKNKPMYNKELASILAGNDVDVSRKEHSGLRKRQKIDYTATKILRYGQSKEKANGNGSSNHENEKEHTVEQDSEKNGQETPVTTDATSDGSSIESMHFESTAQSTGEISDKKCQKFSKSKDVSETDSNTSLRGQREGEYEKVKSRKKSKSMYNREVAPILAGSDVYVSREDHSSLRKRQKIDYTATKILSYEHKERANRSGSSNHESEKELAVEQDSGIDGQETSETTNATSEGSSIESMHFQSTAESAGEISDQNSLQFNESKDVSETGSNTNLSPSSFLVDTFLDSKRCHNDDMKNEDPFSLEDDDAYSTSATKSVSDINNVFSSCEEINQDLSEALIKKQANKNKQKHIKLIYKRKSADILSDSDADISEKGHDCRQRQKVDYTAKRIERIGLETKLKNDQSESTNGTKVKNGKFNQDTERKDQEHEDSRSIKFIHSQSVMKSSRENSDDDAINIDRNGKVCAKTGSELLERPYLLATFSDSEISADDLLTIKQDVLKENSVASSGTEYTSDVENSSMLCHSDSTVQSSGISITADPVRLQQKTIDSFFPLVKQGNDRHKNSVFSDSKKVYNVEKTNEKEDSLCEMPNDNSMINSEAVAKTKNKNDKHALNVMVKNYSKTSTIEHENGDIEDSGCSLDTFTEARIHSDRLIMEIPTNASCSNIHQKGDSRGSSNVRLHGNKGDEHPGDEESASVNDVKLKTYHDIEVDTNNNNGKTHVHEVDGNIGTVSARDIDELQELATATVNASNKNVLPGIEVPNVQNENKKEHLEVGSIVWAVFGKKVWWPAMVVSAEMANKSVKAGWVWLFWLSDSKISQVKESNVEPFRQRFNSRRHKSRGRQGSSLMKRGVDQALELCALRADIDVSMYGNISCWADDNNGFLTIDSSRYKPQKDIPVPSWILEQLGFQPQKASQDGSCLQETCQITSDIIKSSMTIPSSTADSSKTSGRSNNSTSVNTMCATDSPSTASLGYDADCDSIQEDIAVVDGQGSCLGCGVCTGVDFTHPLFMGNICINCRDSLKESFYAIDEDNCSMFCDVCGNGGGLYVCSNDKCGKSFCFDCVGRLTNQAVIKLIQETNHWQCFLCTEYSASTHGGLVPRKDRALETVRFFQAGSIPLCTDLRYMNSGERRKIRVLSLFDGIGSGKLALDELGFDVEVYYVSEIDPDAMLVCDYQHRPVQLGDVYGLNKSKLEEICPIDLILGGPPCNDLSIVNPDRKGFNGTGILVFHFVKILRTIEWLCKGKNHVFWLMENTGSMLNTFKKAICDLLEMEPAVWDAKYFTGQRRARNFWGNIPGMYSVPKFCKQLEKDKKCLDSALIANCNRTANTSHTRTITTSSNSLTITNGVNNALVTMNGQPDHIWVQELERLFGFPTHYTDVGHLTLEKRRKLLGKAWCVPVIKHLLAPLKQYFKVKDM